MLHECKCRECNALVVKVLDSCSQGCEFESGSVTIFAVALASMSKFINMLTYRAILKNVTRKTMTA